MCVYRRQWVCDNTLSAQAKVFCKHYYNMPNLTGYVHRRMIVVWALTYRRLQK